MRKLSESIHLFAYHDNFSFFTYGRTRISESSHHCNRMLHKKQIICLSKNDNDISELYERLQVLKQDGILVQKNHRSAIEYEPYE